MNKLKEIYEKFVSNDHKTARPVVSSKRPMSEIIEEIHESFYTEVDRLLQEAKISKSNYTTKQSLIDKCNRLKAQGFTKTAEVVEAEVEIERLNKIERENKDKQDLVEAINYFSFHYPNYKFITEESVKKICEKYNLIYGSVDRYIGTVPDKNLKHIEDFKIKEEDELWEYSLTFRSWGNTETKRVSKQKADSEEGYYERSSSYYFNNKRKCSLEIAAPRKDFDLKDHEIKDYKISKVEIPDPIVLKPVVFKGKEYRLVVTAWGEEAKDELVFNQRNN